MRLEAKGASGWRLRGGSAASGQPQELTRSQPDIKDDPVGVVWALSVACGASTNLMQMVLTRTGRAIDVSPLPHPNKHRGEGPMSGHWGIDALQGVRAWSLGHRQAVWAGKAWSPTPAAGTLAVSSGDHQ